MMLAITGATGYIGSRLVSAALLAGHEVLALSRTPPVAQGVSWLRYEIGGPVRVFLPNRTQVVFHLAATTESTDVCIDSELCAARQLIVESRRCGALFVFVSSQVASEYAPTSYGRLKWLIEQEVVAAGGVIVRPGLVYGGEARGLFGRLVNLVSIVPIIPAFLPAPRVQPIHVDDLARVLLACSHKSSSGALVQCVPDFSVPFHDFLRAIAGYRLGVSRFVLPVPAHIVRFLGGVVPESIGHRMGLKRINSLLSMKIMEPCGFDADLIKMRSLSEGMKTKYRSRRLDVWSARSVLQYLGKSEPSVSLVRRCFRAGEMLGQSPSLPVFFLRFPVLIGLLDGLFAKRAYRCFSEVERRIAIGISVLEFSSSGARKMLPRDNLWPGVAAARLILLCVKEAIWLMASVVCYPVVFKMLLSSRSRDAKRV